MPIMACHGRSFCGDRLDESLAKTWRLGCSFKAGVVGMASCHPTDLYRSIGVY